MLKHVYSSTYTQSIEAVHVMLPKLGQTAVVGQAYCKGPVIANAMIVASELSSHPGQNFLVNYTIVQSSERTKLMCKLLYLFSSIYMETLVKTLGFL